MSGKKAFIVGASGAVGRRLIDLLVESKDFSKVVLFGRRTLDDIPQTAHIEQRIIDFDNLEAQDFDGFDVGFCSLGTTRSKSGPKMFYVVDHDYVLNTAKMAKQQGTKEFLLVTARSSNENSSLLYYKTKGEVERDVGALGFNKFLIVRPAFLDGPREEKRLSESLGKIFLFKPLQLISNKYVISTIDVAKAMILGSLSDELKGTVIWENATLLEKAAQYPVKAS